MSKKILSFDGKGTNDATDPHCPRIATFVSAQAAKEYGPLFAASPILLDIVQLIIKEWEAPTDGVARGELIARLSQYAPEARAAIKRATDDNA